MNEFDREHRFAHLGSDSDCPACGVEMEALEDGQVCPSCLYATPEEE